MSRARSPAKQFFVPRRATGDIGKNACQASVALASGTKWCGTPRQDTHRLFLERDGLQKPTPGQVFWLPVRPTYCAFPWKTFPQWHVAAFVSGYSGGTATELHRFPYSLAKATRQDKHPCRTVMVTTATGLSTIDDGVLEND
jgi:hypothetical protein